MSDDGLTIEEYAVAWEACVVASRQPGTDPRLVEVAAKLHAAAMRTFSTDDQDFLRSIRVRPTN